MKFFFCDSFSTFEEILKYFLNLTENSSYSLEAFRDFGRVSVRKTFRDFLGNYSRNFLRYSCRSFFLELIPQFLQDFLMKFFWGYLPKYLRGFFRVFPRRLFQEFLDFIQGNSRKFSSYLFWESSQVSSAVL